MGHNRARMVCWWMRGTLGASLENRADEIKFYTRWGDTESMVALRLIHISNVLLKRKKNQLSAMKPETERVPLIRPCRSAIDRRRRLMWATW